MRCPECHKPAEVLESRDLGTYTRRRYECFNSHRFSTMEQSHHFRRGVHGQAPGEPERQLINKIKELLK